MIPFDDVILKNSFKMQLYLLNKTFFELSSVEVDAIIIQVIWILHYHVFWWVAPQIQVNIIKMRVPYVSRDLMSFANKYDLLAVIIVIYLDGGS